MRAPSVPPSALFTEILAQLPLAAITGIIVGIIEEAFFRGVVLGVLLSRMAAAPALVASSAFFASLHFLVAERSLARISHSAEVHRASE